MAARPRERPGYALCVHELFERQAARTPARVALSFEGRNLTYAELDARSSRVARALRALGARPELPVGVLVDRSPALVVALLGVLKAGAAYVPLDPDYPRERIAFMLDDAGARLVVARGADVPAAAGRVTLDIDAPLDDGEVGAREAVLPSSLAYVTYTSGSTGQPKGVAVEHGALANLLESMSEDPGLSENDVLLAVTSVSFDIAGLELFLPLVTGARLAIASAATARNPTALMEAIERSGATVVQATPTTWQMLLASGFRGDRRLRILCGGEPMSERLAAQLLERCGRLFNLYGPTETTIWSTVAAIEAPGAVTVGKPIAQTHVYVVPEGAPNAALTALPPGELGELCIGGAGVARGYWKRPELTAEKFVLDPFRGDGSRLYRTGDLARLRDDGSVELFGRLDRQVKIRGARVEPEEVEAVLAKHPGVAQCVVLGRPGPGDTTRLVAYVVRNARTPVDANGDAMAKWRSVWSGVYRQHESPGDAGFYTAGWNDSVTGLAMSQDEVHEWAQRTADNVLAVKPRRVLEVGCGNGLVLRRVAPHVASYVGLDITQEAVAHVREELKRSPIAGAQVEVRLGSADDVEALPDGQLDCVVLSSIVQYFPSITYAVRVLETALRKVAPGGAVFVGDVRSLALLEAFHMSVEMARSPDALGGGELHRRVREGMQREKELVIEPRLFVELAKANAGVALAEVRPKRGVGQNELTRFRYDVTLWRAPAAAAPPAVSERVAWSEARLSVERLAGWLGAREGGLTVLTGVPNARVAQELAALDALTRSDAPATVGALREVARAAARGAVDPEALCAAAEAAGFTPSLGWSADPGRFDVTLQRRGRTPSDRPSRPGAVSADRASRPRGVSLERPIPADRPSTRRLAEIAAGEQSRADTEWATMANDPSRPTRSEDLARSLRAHLRGELPDAMIPAAFVELDALPRTPAGKLDTAALAALDVGPVRRDGPAMPPSDALEQLLVEIWEDVLRVDGIGVSDDFTELGGDSLLAVDVVARLEKALRGKVSLASVFGTHRLTIAKQAAVVRAQEKAGVDRVSVVALQPGGARPPIFFADTPLNLARHFPPHRPLYDVNIPVVHGRSYDLDRIEPTVAECVNAIRRVDPRGPYYLGGACFAGMLMLETAQRLHESGLEVARLVLIDPDPEEPAPLAARIVRQLRDLTQLPPGQRSEFLRAKRGSIARTARRIAHGRPEHEVKYDSLYEARWGAAEWTHPFPMTLMFTRPRYAPRRDSFAEWKKREGRDLTVQRLPGDRTTVFTEEHIRAVADAIAQSLLPR